MRLQMPHICIRDIFILFSEPQANRVTANQIVIFSSELTCWETQRFLCELLFHDQSCSLTSLQPYGSMRGDWTKWVRGFMFNVSGEENLAIVCVVRIVSLKHKRGSCHSAFFMLQPLLRGRLSITLTIYYKFYQSIHNIWFQTRVTNAKHLHAQSCYALDITVSVCYYL